MGLGARGYGEDDAQGKLPLGTTGQERSCEIRIQKEGSTTQDRQELRDPGAQDRQAHAPPTRNPRERR